MKRFDVGDFCMEEHKKGEYILYTDHLAAVKEARKQAFILGVKHVLDISRKCHECRKMAKDDLAAVDEAIARAEGGA